MDPGPKGRSTFKISQELTSDKCQRDLIIQNSFKLNLASFNLIRSKITLLRCLSEMPSAINMFSNSKLSEFDPMGGGLLILYFSSLMPIPIYILKKSTLNQVGSFIFVSFGAKKQW